MLSKRRKGCNTETAVKRGQRSIKTPLGHKELLEKLGRNDLCPCASGLRFQAVLPAIGPILTARTEQATQDDLD